MRHVRSLHAPLVWTAYVLVPATGWGLLHGVPVGLAGAAVLFVIWWTWCFHGSLPGRWLLVALLALKVVAGLFISVERGLEADYFANAQWAPPIQRSTDFHSPSSTRIDRRLAFGGQERPDFPLYFFTEADRATLPFSVTWRAYVSAPQAEDRRTFYLRGAGVAGELWVDGAQMVHLEPTAKEAVDRARWPAGLRRLAVRLSAPAGTGRQFEAGFVDADGREIPLGAANVTARAYPRWRLFSDRIVRLASSIIDVALLAFLGGMFALTVVRTIAATRKRGPDRRSAVLTLSWIGIMAGGLLFAMPAVDRLVVLGKGQAANEWRARDMLLHAQFYDQPLPAYFLALAHVVFGEDRSGIYLIQWMLVGTAVLLLVPYAGSAKRAVDFLVPPEAE